MKPLHICVEGTKGAGKTTTIESVKTVLLTEGWDVTVHALFAEGNVWAQSQGFAGSVPMMEADLDANACILNWFVKRASSVEAEFMTRPPGRKSILISDRGWITLHSFIFEGALATKDSAYDVGRLGATWWRAVHNAPPTFFIHTKPAVTLRRRVGQLDEVSGLQTNERLLADYELRVGLAKKYKERLAGSYETADGPFVDLAPLVLAKIRKMVEP